MNGPERTRADGTGAIEPGSLCVQLQTLGISAEMRLTWVDRKIFYLALALIGAILGVGGAGILLLWTPDMLT